MNFDDIILNITRHMEAIALDQEKLNKGVKRAGRTVRKHLSDIAKLCKEGRKSALDLTKKDD
jgi:hypothetical protein